MDAAIRSLSSQVVLALVSTPEVLRLRQYRPQAEVNLDRTTLPLSGCIQHRQAAPLTLSSTWTSPLVSCNHHLTGIRGFQQVASEVHTNGTAVRRMSNCQRPRLSIPRSELKLVVDVSKIVDVLRPLDSDINMSAVQAA